MNWKMQTILNYYVRVIDKILFFNSIAGNFQDLVSAYILP